MAAEHRTVTRVLEILETVARAHDPVTLTQLSRALGAPKSSLHGLVGGLLQRGYLRDADGGYRMGAGAHALLQPAGTSLPLLLGPACEADRADVLARASQEEREVYEREEAAIRATGMAFNREETVADLGAVAVEVHESGSLSACLTVAGPHGRVASRLEDLGRLAQEVLAADGFGRDSGEPRPNPSA